MSDIVSGEIGPTRSIQTVLRAILTDEGTEFMVNRTMPQERLPNLNPFALLDVLGPEVPPGHVEGYDAHPHAGIEVLTYCIEGAFENGTPSGEHETEMDAGDMVWMTFGKGAVHFERPAPHIIENGGRVLTAQLWLALPKHAYENPITAQRMHAKDVPVFEGEDGARARVLVGTLFGLTSPLKPTNQVAYTHLTLPPGTSLSPDIPNDYNCFVHILKGEAIVSGGPRLHQRQVALLAPDSTHVHVENPADSQETTECLVVSAKPLEQPLIKAATFVMSSPQEIEECFRKYGHMLGLSFGKDGGPPPA